MIPKFSAIIPLHNKTGTIQRTVRSILAQTIPVDQIVVIDDASTDDSIVKLNSMAIPNITITRRDTPGPGGYAARNMGVELARTEWVGFLDADDEWQPDHLASALEIIRVNPDVNAIFFGRCIVKEGKARREIRLPESRIYSFKELVNIFAHSNVFHINSLVIRRNIYLATGGFNTTRDWRRGGDSEFFLRLIRDAGPLYGTPKITTIYDMNFSEVIRNQKNFHDEHPVHRTVEDAVRKHPKEAAALKRLANRKTVEWLREMDNTLMRKKLSLLSRIYPWHMTMREWYKLFRDFNN